MKYYLGVDIYHWSYDQPDNINFFFSDNFLKHHKKFRPSKCSWALDSGGFSQIHKHGKWTVTPEEYVERTLKYMDKMGKMDFAATQDWMCEDSALKMTGKTVKYHQRKTVESYIKLKELAPNVPWLPILQGRLPKDYIKHLDDYIKAGIKETYFGVGSICRRGNSQDIIDVITEIHQRGIKMHGFGIKTAALKKLKYVLKSADSMAWSYTARMLGKPAYPDCTHKRCNRCYKFARDWYYKQLENIK